MNTYSSFTQEKGQKEELQIPLIEKLKSIPEVFGIRLNEEPQYEVLKKDGPIELRQYSKQLWAQVTIPGAPFNDFREMAFTKLAKYIFGGNRQKENIPSDSSQEYHEERSEDVAMTSPVLQQQDQFYQWTMSFVLPSKYTMATAPEPIDSDIQVIEVPEYTAAVVRYTGHNTVGAIRAHEHELSKWLQSQPHLQVTSKFFTAQYDQPFAIPFLKRNEVQVKVRSHQ